MNRQDMDLIQRVQRKEPDAFDELYHRYYSTIYHMAYQITRNDADAKDACQETFLQIEHSIADLRDPSLFQNWIKKIVVGKCSRIFERNHYRPVDPDVIAKVDKSKEHRRYMQPKNQTDFENDQDILMSMIDQLKPNIREAIVLMYFEQMKLQEISTMLNVPLSTIKSRVKKGKTELQRLIKLFEKTEGRNLDFNLDLALPITGLYSLLNWNVIRDRIIQTCSGNMVNVACVASITTLSVTGSVFAYQDYKEAQTPQTPKTVLREDAPKTTSPKEQEQPREEDVVKTPFSTTQYKDIQVENYMQAYFTCINWADTKEKMKDKTKEEFQEIQPIYESLKKEHGTYYNALTQLNWVEAYEELASDMDIIL